MDNQTQMQISEREIEGKVLEMGACVCEGMGQGCYLLHGFDYYRPLLSV